MPINHMGKKLSVAHVGIRGFKFLRQVSARFAIVRKLLWVVLGVGGRLLSKQNTETAQES